MPEHYYTSDENYPVIVKSIIERMKVFIVKLFYLDEDYDTAKQRFILANFEASDEVGIRRSIETFKTSQSKFPFTAYNIGEEENTSSNGSSYTRKSGLYYNPLYQVYMKSVPGKLVMPSMTFFSNSYDYQQARMRIVDTESVLTRLEVPVYINDILAQFPIDIDFTTSKGSLAYAFEEYLRVGKIFNIAMECSISFPYLIVNTANVHNYYVPARIAPVDDIITSLYSFSNVHYNDNPQLEDSIYSPNIPEVTSTSPIEGETDFDPSSPIIFNFNLSMNEDSVFTSLTSDPFISAEVLWNDDSNQLILDPETDLSTGILYTITIANTAKSGDTVPLEDDFVLTFTTGF